MTELADSHARVRIATGLDTTLIVEAAAGTGKTTQLVGRILNLIRTGRATLDRILAVTFTEKAAGEMKLRLRTEIERACGLAETTEERERFDAALAAIEVAHINTIHGVCADLLRERPIEAGVDPGFGVLDERAAEQLLSQAFDAWFQRVLDDPPEGVRRVLSRRGWDSSDGGPRRQLLRACSDFIEHRDFNTDWERPAYARNANIDALLQRFAALGALSSQSSKTSDPLALALGEFQRFLDEVLAREKVRVRDYDDLEAKLVRFAKPRYKGFGYAAWRNKGTARQYAPNLLRADLVELRDETRRELDQFLENAQADVAALLQQELAVVVAERETLKNKAGRLDFVDLLLEVRDLLVHDQAVRNELQQQFTNVLVDEFQDTDPLQAEILLLLAADDGAVSDFTKVTPVPGKLFVVGDPKQSIYRFRRADIVFYEDVKRQLLERGAELVHLTTSFRSAPEIQTVVNTAFSARMTTGQRGQAEYVPLTQFRPSFQEQPAVIALPVPHPYGQSGRLTKKAVEESTPDAVGAFVTWLVRQSGWKVDEAGARVALEARHVCLLFRRMQAFGRDLTHDYVRALEARRVAHVLVGGRSLHEREEIIALRAALNAIEWPDDELSVYATLHGPFFAIDDADLFLFREQVGRLLPMRQLQEAHRDAHPIVVGALEDLRKLHLNRNRRPIADTIAVLLETTRAHAAIAIWPTGEQALANVLSVLDDARAFDVSATSFRAFVDWLEERAEHGLGQDALVVEEGAEGVRLMTVHKAKGLEFPVVVLCDPTAPLDATFASRYIDSERKLWAFNVCGCTPKPLSDNEQVMLAHESAEIVRLGYVAATRAKDLLVIPTFGDGRAGTDIGMGWVDLLAPALYPSNANRRNPAAAPGCPEFGDDTVRTRFGDATPDDCVVPGRHTGSAGETNVVWWDPHLLELNVQAKGGVRQQELLKELPESAANIAAHAEWANGRSSHITRASVPTIIALPVTKLAASCGVNPSGSIAIERTNALRDRRPGGIRFGTLVHALLATVPLNSTRETIALVGGAQGRLVGATSVELAAAIDAVVAALAHPLLQRAACADEARREDPVVHRLQDGSLAEGIVDLAFREDEHWTVVDFKTDTELSTTSHYATQVQLYADAISAASGRPATGILLSV